MKYNNTYVAKELNDIAFLYGQKGDKFRERAYKRASEGISSFSGNLKKVKDFTQFPHIGVNIAKTIEDVLAGRKTKKKKLLKDKSLVPVEVLELTKLSGIGQKKAADLYRKHKIVSIDQLKKKIKKKTITDMKLVEAVKSYNKNNERLPLYMADATAKQFYSELLQFNLDFEIHEAGSLRRRKSTVKNIDLIISAERHVLDRLVSIIRNKFKILVEGTSKVRVSYNVIEGFTKVIDLVLCTPEEFGSALLYFTDRKALTSLLDHMLKGLGIN